MNDTFTIVNGLAVCGDCIVYTANGCDCPDCDGDTVCEPVLRWQSGVTNVWPEARELPIAFHAEMDAPCHFSWQVCDGCGDKLGGDRYDASAVIG